MMIIVSDFYKDEAEAINIGWISADVDSRMDKKHPFFLDYTTQASSLLEGC